MTFTPATNEKPPEFGGLVDPCLLSLSVDKSRGWARQDSNAFHISTEKPQIAKSGAVKSAAFIGDSSFASAVAAIMALPLDDREKAEAVRRLLAGMGDRP